MTQYTAKKVYIKDAAGNYAVPYVNPADNTNLGVVKPDGVTISTASDGTISTNNKSLSVVTAYANDGELLTDADGLAFVEKYAHSTYCGDQPSNASPLDPKKFIKIGSPNITDDGIASGLDTSNYLYITPEQKSYNNFIINFNYVYSASGNINTYSTIGNFYQIYNNGTGASELKLITYENRNAVIKSITVTGMTQTVGVEYNVKIIINNLNIRYSVTNLSTGVEVHNDITLNEAFTIGSGFPKALVLYNVQSADYKKAYIIVDGVLVFSGNKTGIDTIKPSNFNVITSSASSPFVNPSLPFSDNGLTISADGVASGFSSSNYLLVNGTGINNTATSWEIATAFTTNLTGSLQEIWCEKVSNQAQGYISIETSNKLRMHLMADDGTPIINWVLGSTVLSDNTNYMVKMIYTGTTYQVLLTNLSTSVTTTEANVPSNKKVRDISNIAIGVRGIGTPDNPNAGSIDLNAFKIYVDGNLVYQPCLKIPYTESKTGSKIVNAIYRDRVNDMADQFGYANYYTLQEEDKGNYTVVGSPTISSDFVASGFSGSDYITQNINFSTLSTINSLTVEGKFVYQYTSDATSTIFGFSATAGYINSPRLHIDTSGDLHFYMHDGSHTQNGTIERSTYNLQNGDIIHFKTIYSNASVNITFSVNGGEDINVVKSNNSNMSLDFNSLETVLIGHFGGSSSYSRGSIDLKEFKIYVDNKLAYQAVIDPNFTLPQVELYGLIGQRTLRDSYRNGINYWELYSNRDLEQGGSCTSGVEVTFPKPFEDTNYVLSVPYSAKSATAFTPTQTGDWIAKGKGIL